MKKNIPFIDLKAQYKTIKKDIDSAIRRVVDSGLFGQGEEVNLFEKEFAVYIGAKHCISLNSGTDALILGIRALELSPGDEVIVPSSTFISTALAITENRLRPVFVDTDESDFGINLADLKRKITRKTKAIILVHLYGQPDKIDEVQDIIKKTGRKIYLIEDACQAHGAKYKNKKVGNFGIFSAFSFYPTKNFGAYGDGGAIITNDKRLSEKYRLLKQYGEKKRYYSEVMGINSRLDTIQAAILRVKLKRLDKWNKKRRQAAHTYTHLFKKASIPVTPPKEYEYRKSIYHLYVIRTRKRDKLQEFLKEKGIISLIHYPLPLHLQKTFRYLNYKKGSLPVSEKISDEVLSLPLYPELTNDQIMRVTNIISNFKS